MRRRTGAQGGRAGRVAAAEPRPRAGRQAEPAQQPRSHPSRRTQPPTRAARSGRRHPPPRATDAPDGGFGKRRQELRERTGAATDGSEARRGRRRLGQGLLELLRVRSAAKCSGRATNEGVIAPSSGWAGRSGVLVEVQCGRPTSLLGPTTSSRRGRHPHRRPQPASLIDEIPDTLRCRTPRLRGEGARGEGKPDNVIERIVEGQLAKAGSTSCCSTGARAHGTANEGKWGGPRREHGDGALRRVGEEGARFSDKVDVSRPRSGRMTRHAVAGRPPWLSRSAPPPLRPRAPRMACRRPGVRARPPSSL